MDNLTFWNFTTKVYYAVGNKDTRKAPSSDKYPFCNHRNNKVLTFVSFYLVGAPDFELQSE